MTHRTSDVEFSSANNDQTENHELRNTSEVTSVWNPVSSQKLLLFISSQISQSSVSQKRRPTCGNATWESLRIHWLLQQRYIKKSWMSLKFSTERVGWCFINEWNTWSEARLTCEPFINIIFLWARPHLPDDEGAIHRHTPLNSVCNMTRRQQTHHFLPHRHNGD